MVMTLLHPNNAEEISSQGLHNFYGSCTAASSVHDPSEEENLRRQNPFAKFLLTFIEEQQKASWLETSKTGMWYAAEPGLESSAAGD